MNVSWRSNRNTWPVRGPSSTSRMTRMILRGDSPRIPAKRDRDRVNSVFVKRSLAVNTWGSPLCAETTCKFSAPSSDEASSRVKSNGGWMGRMVPPRGWPEGVGLAGSSGVRTTLDRKSHHSGGTVRSERCSTGHGTRFDSSRLRNARRWFKIVETSSSSASGCWSRIPPLAHSQAISKSSSPARILSSGVSRRTRRSFDGRYRRSTLSSVPCLIHPRDLACTSLLCTGCRC